MDYLRLFPRRGEESTLGVPAEPQVVQSVLISAPFVPAIGAALPGTGKAEEEPKHGEFGHQAG